MSDSTDGRIERAKDAALGKHDNHPSHVDEAGEATGGIGGTVVGAAIGSVAGPVGTLIGGIAGALGGWWSGRAVTEAASKLSKEDDEFYRSSYERSPNRLADRSFDDVRPAYHLGQIASQNPDYANMRWSDVQSEIGRGWNADSAARYGDWQTVSGYAAEGYERGRSRIKSAAERTAESMENREDRAP